MGDPLNRWAEVDLAVLAQGKCQLITTIQQLKHRLQIVVTVLTTASDMQKQVEFGGSGEAEVCHKG
ncbi:hypothetical protein R50073_33290 [Maricurvus nonylphenolicus]